MVQMIWLKAIAGNVATIICLKYEDNINSISTARKC